MTQQVSLEDTPYYHCISRCVRRAFLCGEDSVTGENYEHRKSWVVEKLVELSEVFAIDVCAYAITMSADLRSTRNSDLAFSLSGVVYVQPPFDSVKPYRVLCPVLRCDRIQSGEILPCGARLRSDVHWKVVAHP